MNRSIIRSVVLFASMLVGCAATDEASAPEPASVEQAIGDPCLDSCRLANIACIHACIQSQDGGDCGCPQEVAECRLECPNGDSDLDGVLNSADNCPAVANANQSNCDGDAFGDACDSLNANYQAAADHTCWTAKVQKSSGLFFEDRVEHLEHDVSTCGAPDRWVRRTALQASCVGTFDDFSCCSAGLGPTIQSFGDGSVFWCANANRNMNRCH